MTDDNARADRERTSRTSRRSYLGALAGIAAVPAFGSVASAADDDVLTIVGRGSTAHYAFSVSGDVEKSSAHGATINSFARIDDSRVTGRTTNEPDSFAFTGEITDFETDASVDVSINGESIDTAEIGGDAGSTETDDLSVSGNDRYDVFEY